MCHIVSGIDADITHETAACTVARLYVGVLSEAPTAIVSGFWSQDDSLVLDASSQSAHIESVYCIVMVLSSGSSDNPRQSSW